MCMYACTCLYSFNDIFDSTNYRWNINIKYEKYYYPFLNYLMIQPIMW